MKKGDFVLSESKEKRAHFSTLEVQKPGLWGRPPTPPEQRAQTPGTAVGSASPLMTLTSGGLGEMLALIIRAIAFSFVNSSHSYRFSGWALSG